MNKELRDGHRDIVGGIVQQEATNFGYGVSDLEKLKADVQQAYLRDRGKRLLRDASKIMANDKAENR